MKINIDLRIRRLLASLLDLFIFFTGHMILTFMISAISDQGIFHLSSNIVYVLLALLLYVTVPLINNGSTVGKSILNFKITDKNGETPNIFILTFRSSFIFISIIGALMLLLLDIDSSSTIVENVIFYISILFFLQIIFFKNGTILDALFKTKGAFYKRADNTLKIRRILASLLDLSIYLSIFLFITWVWLISTMFSVYDINMFHYTIFYILLGIILYTIIPSITQGSTIGQFILNLGVLDTKDKKPNIFILTLRSPFLFSLMFVHLLLLTGYNDIHFLFPAIISSFLFIFFIQISILNKGTILDILLKTKVVSKNELIKNNIL